MIKLAWGTRFIRGMLLSASTIAIAASRTLIVDRDANQCTSNADCAKLPGTTCNSGVCVAAACTKDMDCPSGES